VPVPHPAEINAILREKNYYVIMMPQQRWYSPLR